MTNNYGWNLSRERDVLIHGTAHYSKNWTKENQREYNHWYYENKLKGKRGIVKSIKNAITGEDDLASAAVSDRVAESNDELADMWGESANSELHEANKFKNLAEKSNIAIAREVAKQWEDRWRDNQKTSKSQEISFRRIANDSKKEADAYRYHYENRTLKGISEQIQKKGLKAIYDIIK